MDPDGVARSSLLLAEYSTLRSEVLERIRIAFSHMGYAGAVVAFAIPASSSTNQTITRWALGAAAVAFLILLYIAAINWSWVRVLGAHLRRLEERINELHNAPLLSWQATAKRASTWVLWFPRRIESTTHAGSTATSDPEAPPRQT